MYQHLLTSEQLQEIDRLKIDLRKYTQKLGSLRNYHNKQTEFAKFKGKEHEIPAQTQDRLTEYSQKITQIKQQIWDIKNSVNDLKPLYKKAYMQVYQQEYNQGRKAGTIIPVPHSMRGVGVRKTSSASSERSD